MLFHGCGLIIKWKYQPCKCIYVSIPICFELAGGFPTGSAEALADQIICNEGGRISRFGTDIALYNYNDEVYMLGMISYFLSIYYIKVKFE